MSETNTSDTSVFIKGTPGRKKIYDVDYKQHVKDVKYNLKYYHAHKTIKIECDRCNKSVTKFSFKEHQRSKYCIAVYASKQTPIVITSEEKRQAEEKEHQIEELEMEMNIIRRKLDLLYSA